MLLPFVLVALAACTGTGGSPSPGRSLEQDSFVLPSSGNKSIPPAAQVFQGVLSFDSIEGGCAFIEAPDGTRYEVVYPEGWTLDVAGQVLHGPEGEEAPAGMTLQVQGTIATDRASTCQVGPIVVATSVTVSPA